MRKKLLAVFMVTTMGCSVFVGCGEKDNSNIEGYKSIETEYINESIEVDSDEVNDEADNNASVGIVNTIEFDTEITDVANNFVCAYDFIITEKEDGQCEITINDGVVDMPMFVTAEEYEKMQEGCELQIGSGKYKRIVKCVKAEETKGEFYFVEDGISLEEAERDDNIDVFLVSSFDLDREQKGKIRVYKNYKPCYQPIPIKSALSFPVLLNRTYVEYYEDPAEKDSIDSILFADLIADETIKDDFYKDNGEHWRGSDYIIIKIDKENNIYELSECTDIK